MAITIKAMMIITFHLTLYFGMAATLKMWLQPRKEFYNDSESVYLSLCVAEKKLERLFNGMYNKPVLNFT